MLMSSLFYIHNGPINIASLSSVKCRIARAPVTMENTDITSQHSQQEIFVVPHASTLTQNATSPVGPVTPRIYWSCKFLTGPTFFSLT